MIFFKKCTFSHTWRHNGEEGGRVKQTEICHMAFLLPCSGVQPVPALAVVDFRRHPTELSPVLFHRVTRLRFPKTSSSACLENIATAPASATCPAMQSLNTKLSAFQLLAGMARSFSFKFLKVQHGIFTLRTASIYKLFGAVILKPFKFLFFFL